MYESVDVPAGYAKRLSPEDGLISLFLRRNPRRHYFMDVPRIRTCRWVTFYGEHNLEVELPWVEYKHVLLRRMCVSTFASPWGSNR